jgi:hypothetical protein
LPKRALTNFDLEKYLSIIPHFRGVFMRDSLPICKPKRHECGVLNLENSQSRGSHWTCYYKKDNYIEYFDSFGNLQPPRELIKYLGKNIYFNFKKYQSFNQINCGHLCIKFLFNFYNHHYA